MHSKNVISYQRGMTIIELLLAMAISLLLSIIVIQVYLGSKQSYRMTEALSHLQENGRFALEILSTELRLAGYQGCGDPEVVEPNIISNTAIATSDSLFDTALRGFETSSSGWTSASTDLPSSFESEVLASSDVIAVRYGDEPVAVVNDTGTAIVAASNPGNIAVGDVAMVGDCTSADIFPVSSASGNSFSYSTALGSTYGTNAELMAFISRVFYVGDTGRTNDAGDSIFALYQRNTDGSIDELIEGVETMQILYGERVGDNIRYVPADSITWPSENVISIRVGLLMSSRERVIEADDDFVYQVAGTAVGPSQTISHPVDRRLRRVYTTTINLRNRDT